MRHYSAFVAVAALSISLIAHAGTLAVNTAGTQTNGSAEYFGQSFTVVGSGTFDDITFNFYTGKKASTLTPYAIGTGFLFSSAYSGTPAALGSSDPGYLGSASSSGGVYSFAPSLDLTSGTQYFFYENAAIPAGAIYGNNPVSGQGLAVASGANVDFVSEVPYGINMNFLVTGRAATPELSSFVLLGTGLLGFGGMLRRRLA